MDEKIRKSIRLASLASSNHKIAQAIIDIEERLKNLEKSDKNC